MWSIRRSPEKSGANRAKKYSQNTVVYLIQSSQGRQGCIEIKIYTLKEIAPVCNQKHCMDLKLGTWTLFPNQAWKCENLYLVVFFEIYGEFQYDFCAKYQINGIKYVCISLQKVEVYYQISISSIRTSKSTNFVQNVRPNSDFQKKIINIC